MSQLRLDKKEKEEDVDLCQKIATYKSKSAEDTSGITTPSFSSESPQNK